MNEILIFFLGACFVAMFAFGIVVLEMKREEKKNYDRNTNFFKEIYTSLLSTGKFLSRVNDNIDVSIILDGKTHNLIYIMDKSEIAIFLGKDCLSISSGMRVDRKIIDKIISEINSRWSKKIKSVVNINGSIIDSATYNRITSNFPLDEEVNSSKKISFDLDDILDKISQVGYDNLSDSEKEFLTKFK